MLAEKTKIAIREGTFVRPSEEAAVTRETLTLRQLLELYGERVVQARGEESKTAYDYAVGVISRTAVPTLSGTPLPFGDWKVTDVCA